MTEKDNSTITPTVQFLGAESVEKGRLRTSTPSLDAAELDWWHTFADVEDRFCWVQTPALQRFLRGDYLRDIARTVASSDRVAELGCGAGWLEILLVRLGCTRVVGYDFSPKQIEIAQKRAAEAGVAGSISFTVADAAKLQGVTDEFDVVIVHGFLHHLAMDEISDVIQLAHRMLHRGGKLIVFEPVMYSNHAESLGTRLARRLNAYVVKLAKLHGRHWRLRLIGAEEQAVRNLLARRAAGVPPRGASPKEIPFGPDELPAILQPLFQVTRRRRCMTGSHLIAQELLLLQLTYPRLGRAMFWPIVWAGRWIDRWLLAADEPPGGMWVFEMFECLRVESTEEQDRK